MSKLTGSLAEHYVDVPNFHHCTSLRQIRLTKSAVFVSDTKYRTYTVSSDSITSEFISVSDKISTTFWSVDKIFMFMNIINIVPVYKLLSSVI